MTRLTEQDWLDHGLKTVAKAGHGSLKAATMAAALGVSRGSFYWHFKDIGAFHARLLDHWQRLTTDAIIQEMDATVARERRLSDLMIRAYATRPGLDRAIRVWAEYDAQARAHLKKVDKLRIGYIAKLLTDSGLPASSAAQRARFIYAASLGDGQIAPGTTPPLSEVTLREFAALLSEETKP